MKSNINVLSNIYPLNASRASSDPEFIKQIRCRKALEIAVREMTGGGDQRTQAEVLRRRGFPAELIDLYRKDNYCSVLINELGIEEYPYGLVVKDEDKHVECRCLYRECLHHRECIPVK